MTDIKIIEALAYSPDFTRNTTLLHHLYICGGHQLMSTTTAAHAFKARTPIVRTS